MPEDKGSLLEASHRRPRAMLKSLRWFATSKCYLPGIPASYNYPMVMLDCTTNLIDQSLTPAVVAGPESVLHEIAEDVVRGHGQGVDKLEADAVEFGITSAVYALTVWLGWLRGSESCPLPASVITQVVIAPGELLRG